MLPPVHAVGRPVSCCCVLVLSWLRHLEAHFGVCDCVLKAERKERKGDDGRNAGKQRA